MITSSYDYVPCGNFQICSFGAFGHDQTDGSFLGPYWGNPVLLKGSYLRQLHHPPYQLLWCLGHVDEQLAHHRNIQDFGIPWCNRRYDICCEKRYRVLLLRQIMVAGTKSDCVTTLQWHQNEQNSVSNHQPHGCLLHRLYRRRSTKTSKLCVTGLCVGNSPGPVNSLHNGPMTWKMFPFVDVIMRVENEMAKQKSPLPCHIKWTLRTATRLWGFVIVWYQQCLPIQARLMNL